MRNNRQIKTAGQAFEPLVRIAEAGSTLNRWSHWSKSIAGRRLRTVQPRSAMALNLLDRTRTVLNLARQSITQHLHFHVGGMVLEAGTGSRQTNHAGPGRGPDRRLPAQVMVEDVVRTGGSGFDRGLPRRVEPVALSPLQQVFRRIEQTELAGTSRQTLSLHKAISLTRRLREERQRIELNSRRESPFVGRATDVGPSQSPQQALVKARSLPDRDSGRAPMILNRSAKKEEPDELASTSPPFTRRSEVERQMLPVSPAAPPINMEQITDHVIRQLDHRLIAHRERMGRPGY